MSNFSKLSEQKRVNDRSEKNDTRNKVERLPLNPVRELCENRRNLYVLVAIDRRWKVSSRHPCNCGRRRSQTQRQSEAKKKQRFARKRRDPFRSVSIPTGDTIRATLTNGRRSFSPTTASCTSTSGRSTRFSATHSISREHSICALDSSRRS
jgi:hypothetical protein